MVAAASVQRLVTVITTANDMDTCRWIEQALNTLTQNHDVVMGPSTDRSARATFNELDSNLITQVSAPFWPDTGGPLAEEITYIRSNATVDRGERYQIVSATSQASISHLEAAGDEYPAWVTELNGVTFFLRLC